MPISTRLEVDIQPIEELSYFMTDFQSEVYRIAGYTADEVQPYLLDELYYYPPPAKHPIQWTSERQRKFVMAKLRRENNIPYSRTYSLRKGWRVGLAQVADGFAFQVQNDAEYTQFVVGSLAKDTSRARAYQQQFHRKTGWVLASDTITFWFDAFYERLNENVQQELSYIAGDVNTRRVTYTPRRKARR
jgi:hypothetical protein